MQRPTRTFSQMNCLSFLPFSDDLHASLNAATLSHSVHAVSTVFKAVRCCHHHALTARGLLTTAAHAADHDFK